jgi:hypothetical protein
MLHFPNIGFIETTIMMSMTLFPAIIGGFLGASVITNSKGKIEQVKNALVPATIFGACGFGISLGVVWGYWMNKMVFEKMFF